MEEISKHIAPEGHPIHTLMTEHMKILEFADELIEKTEKLATLDSYMKAVDQMQAVKILTDHFKDSEKHYLREENVLFAYLDRHGISGPTKVMWTEHDNIRDLKKKLYSLVDNAGNIPYDEFVSLLDTLAKSLKELLLNHFYKENLILFRMTMETLSDEEWNDISRQFAEIGYCGFSPTVAEVEPETVRQNPAREGEIAFETGHVSPHVLEAMLNTLPVEITFIDAEDTVRYFSQPEHMLFARSKAIIGNKVQNCHPQKSVHLVNQIVAEFRDGQRDVAQFWIDMKGRKVYIRYFAVRDKAGEYLGCMEVTQDITNIQKIEGQKRLLD